MASVRRFLFRAQSLEKFLKFRSLSLYSRKQNVYLPVKMVNKCLQVSSLEKKCSKYDSLYRASGSTLLSKSEQYQENETSSTLSSWFFYIASAVVFSVIYTSTNTAYTAGGENQLTEFRLSRVKRVKMSPRKSSYVRTLRIYR